VILVDTSAWVGYLRGDERPAVARLAELLDRGSPVAVTAIVAQELLQGVASGPVFDRLERYLSSQRRLEPVDPWHAAVEAARMFGACRAAGVTVRSTLDCLIARIAIEHGVALLHDDRDFDLIAGVVPELRLA
jgi:predicted nucleic acid-binding protein